MVVYDGKRGTSMSQKEGKEIFIWKNETACPCDFKLAFISLWWRRMEREGLNESQENPMRERMILYLKAGKKDELKKNVNT